MAGIKSSITATLTEDAITRTVRDTTVVVLRFQEPGRTNTGTAIWTPEWATPRMVCDNTLGISSSGNVAIWTPASRRQARATIGLLLPGTRVRLRFNIDARVVLRSNPDGTYQRPTEFQAITVTRAAALPPPIPCAAS